MWFFKKRDKQKAEYSKDEINDLQTYLTDVVIEEELKQTSGMEEEYEIVEREIVPESIICPDCGGLTLRGLEYCDKCGGEISPK